jgi:F-type H+-transporting ATPase subunit a
MNYLGLIPGLAGPSANITVTGSLALMVFIVFNVTGMVKNGPINYIMNLVPKGLPFIITLIMFPIEVIGVFVKGVALAIRLFANMAAGHFVVMALLAITIVLQHSAIGLAAVPFTVAMLCLKLLVGLIQAYVFTLLTTLYIGSAIHQDH